MSNSTTRADTRPTFNPPAFATRRMAASGPDAQHDLRPPGVTRMGPTRMSATGQPPAPAMAAATAAAVAESPNADAHLRASGRPGDPDPPPL